MRDSRIGTYGTLALIFLILGKFTFLLVAAVKPDLALADRGAYSGKMDHSSAMRVVAICPSRRSGKLVAKQVGVVCKIVAGHSHPATGLPTASLAGDIRCLDSDLAC